MLLFNIRQRDNWRGPGGYGNYDIWVTTRATTEDAWGQPVNLGPTVNSSYSENSPNISADGLMMRVGQTAEQFPQRAQTTLNSGSGSENGGLINFF